jgi:hypothetical protein
MANGVEEHPKTRARLKRRFRCAEPEREGFADVEIVDEKVEMKTLGLWTFGPRRGNAVRDFLKPNSWVTVIEQLDPRHVFGKKVTERLDLESAK